MNESIEKLCPICNSEGLFWDKKNKLNIFKCIKCGHGYITSEIKKEDLNKYYDKKYAKNYNPKTKNKESILRKKQYILDIRDLKKYMTDDKLDLFNKNISVLDIGCSMGGFLNSMPKEWDKNGYEINKYEIDYINKNIKNINIFNDFKQINKKFDVITLRGVIEHFFDFKILFKQLNKLLKKNGIIYICATPDFDSPCGRLYKKEWNQFVPPIHFHQFTFTSAVLLFAQNNFIITKISHPYKETVYCDFINDSKCFLNNINCGDGNKEHAFIGNMMSLIFKKI